MFVQRTFVNSGQHRCGHTHTSEATSVTEGTDITVCVCVLQLHSRAPKGTGGAQTLSTMPFLHVIVHRFTYAVACDRLIKHHSITQ